ncbi:hypothetical protein [Burkholderia sp. Bp8963]|uniref:hypothetical protein n=1 Tax=Burkholderia sp. Bp8963 TaxID=2184547 RepID=UPI00163960BD|nr:hypothetical protein [Burkholderia sp. Bp8963]
MFDPWVQTDRSVGAQRACVGTHPEIAVAAAEFEQELVLRVRVSDKRPADEVHRGSAEFSLQNPDRLF